MVEPDSGNIRLRLAEILADSLTAPLPSLTPRKVLGTPSLPGKATVAIGMRRAGKTYYMHQMRRGRMDQDVARDFILPYINFEDERLTGITAAHLHPLIEEFLRNHPELRGRRLVTWCFDEIQVVPEWERFVRRLIDSEKVEVVVTGSSAALLSREIATSLRGRAWEVVIHPFSFEEALRHRGQDAPGKKGPFRGRNHRPPSDPFWTT